MLPAPGSLAHGEPVAVATDGRLQHVSSIPVTCRVDPAATPRLVVVGNVSQSLNTCALGEQPREQDDMEISREVAEQVQIFDDPDGVLPELREIRNALARVPWSCPVSQQAAMRRLAIAQLGSASLDAEDFRARVLELTIRRALPSALRGAAGVNPKHATALFYAAEQCED